MSLVCLQLWFNLKLVQTGCHLVEWSMRIEPKYHDDGGLQSQTLKEYHTEVQ
jgi:hypothetical protein